MITVNITMQGADMKKIAKLPVYIENDAMDALGEIAQFVQRSAKSRAPRFSGTLAKSIIVKKQNKNTISVETAVPWAAQMETGEGLPKYETIKGNYLLQEWLNKTNHGKSKKRDSGYRDKGRLPRKSGMVVVSHYKPFMQPALDASMNRLDELINRAIDKSISKI